MKWLTTKNNKEFVMRQAEWAGNWTKITFFVATGILTISIGTQRFSVFAASMFMFFLSSYLSQQSYYWGTIYRIKYDNKK